MKDPKPSFRFVSIESPMSAANLSAGFDVLGVALDAYHDELDIELDKNQKTISVISNVELPEENTARRAAELFFKKVEFSGGVKINLKKGIPAGKGLGSSGASAAGVAFALNIAFGNILNLDEVIDIAANSESSPHADNVSASLLGGFSFVYARNPYSAFSIYRDWKFYIIIPKSETPSSKTELLRKALGEPVAYEMYVEEKYAFNSMLKGLLYDDQTSFGKGMNTESYHQYVRARTGLYTDFIKLKKPLLDSGALGVCISGAGPSILVLPGEGISLSTVNKIIKDYEVKADAVEARVSEGIKIKKKEL